VNEHEWNSRLSRISTEWTVVFQAITPHPGSAETGAQQALLQRYCGAVYRYLLGALGDPAAADQAAQEFALRFVRGELQRADPGKGRFRDFVKTALYPLVVDYQKRQKRSGVMTPRPTPEGQAAHDRDFTTSWREELMTKAWDALAQLQEKSGQPLHAALRLRAEKPELHSEALAAELGPRLGRPVTAAEVRQAVHTARQKFAEFLVAEVAHSLESSDPQRLVQELIELGLTDYCRPALEKPA
jgi:DNA-directed RNA polymerase specialized sigma24 family protein